MGCQGSKPAGAVSLGAGNGFSNHSVAAAGGSSSSSASATVKDKKKQLDPADYMLSKLSGKMEVKEQGSIDGEQFNIEECSDCDIFLLDRIAQVFVDECKNCRIFIGPTESSVFIRNCQNCNLVLACQQFRARDCLHCKVALFCTTQPIIETSQQMSFACFDFFYFSLREQLAKAGLKLWNNKWWQIHDFNHNHENPNWALFSQEDVPSLLRTQACAALCHEELNMDRIVPLTLGSRPRPSEEACFVIFLPGTEQTQLEDFLQLVGSAPGWALCRARSTFLGEEQCKVLFSGWMKGKDLKKVMAACSGHELTAMEVCGSGVRVGVEEVLAKGGPLSTCASFVYLPPKDLLPQLAKLYFETWKDQI